MPIPVGIQSYHLAVIAAGRPTGNFVPRIHECDYYLTLCERSKNNPLKFLEVCSHLQFGNITSA